MNDKSVAKGRGASKRPLCGICLAAVAALAGLGTLAGAQGASPPDIPANIRAPQGEKLILRAHASGAQIYVCGADGKLEWTLKAPEAVLRDDQGIVMGHHFAGPTWKHQDGSEVSGKLVARADSPDAGSIPWLLVTATGHKGLGILTRVTSIQRIHTKGGQTPASACDASKSGTEVKSPYTADYYFYAP